MVQKVLTVAEAVILRAEVQFKFNGHDCQGKLTSQDQEGDRVSFHGTIGGTPTCQGYQIPQDGISELCLK